MAFSTLFTILFTMLEDMTAKASLKKLAQSIPLHLNYQNEKVRRDKTSSFPWNKQGYSLIILVPCFVILRINLVLAGIFVVLLISFTFFIRVCYPSFLVSLWLFPNLIYLTTISLILSSFVLTQTSFTNSLDIIPLIFISNAFIYFYFIFLLFSFFIFFYTTISLVF